jgi:hypothetical protein
VLVHTCVTSKNNLWLYMLDILVGNQGAISAQGNRKIQDQEVM